jgi:putative CocE/NonD family hydrolase
MKQSGRGIHALIPMLMLVLIEFSPSATAGDSGFANWAELEQALVTKSIRRQWVPMRDGVRLDANIFLPKNGQAPYPTVLLRSPYPDEIVLDIRARNSFFRKLMEQGYAIVFQNERGRYWSEGSYDFLVGARNDGYDTVDWISRQQWSNGKVGTYGCSSSAEHQLALSVAAHPAHMAAIAQAPGAGIGRIGPYAEQGNFYRGGALQLFFAGWYRDFAFYGGETADQRPTFPPDLSQADRIRLSKMFRLWPEHGLGRVEEGFDYLEFFAALPVGTLNSAINGPVTNWSKFATRTPGDPDWFDTDFVNDGDEFGVPMLWMFSWYDIAVAPNVAMFNHARQHTSTRRAKDNQFMVISPMPHCQLGNETETTMVGQRNLGDARFDYDTFYLEWFDFWLKGKENDALSRPRVQFYQMGANEWREYDQFPPDSAEPLDLYLASVEGANSRYGDGTLSEAAPVESGDDHFVFDPHHPVPTTGGWSCCMGTLDVTGARDQTDLEIRQDILVYSTGILDDDLAVAGFIEIELFVSSDAKDTDFTVKLVDVDESGRSFNLADTILRARYREGYDRQVFMMPDQVYRLNITPIVTANTFRKGHRLRVEISSSNFPRYGRNMNTGGNNHDEAVPVKARNRVHHSPDHPSRIRLSIIR